MIKKLFTEQLAQSDLWASVDLLATAMQTANPKLSAERARLGALRALDLNASGEGNFISAIRSVFGRADAQRNTQFLHAVVEAIIKHIPQDDIVRKIAKIPGLVSDGGEVVATE
jgi:hypothetical protein